MQTMYERVGGHDFFHRLVDAFYEGVASDEPLASMYPEAPDFDGARHRLALFLIQYWGGPTTYMEERGHPRLRMRHFPFPIGTDARDRWLNHMRAAVDAVALPLEDGGTIAAELMAYFEPAADQMRNQGLTIRHG